MQSVVQRSRQVEFARSLDAIASGRLDVSPLITGHVGLDGVAAAFEELANPEQHVKILVRPNGLGLD